MPAPQRAYESVALDFGANLETVLKALISGRFLARVVVLVTRVFFAKYEVEREGGRVGAIRVNWSETVCVLWVTF